MNADLQHLYAHHAVGLCPEERCVAAREGLAALVEERTAIYTVEFSNYDPPETDGIFSTREAAQKRADELNASSDWEAWDVHVHALQAAVASREGSGTL